MGNKLHVEGRDKVVEKNRETMEDVFQKLPPNYTVGTLYVNGALVPVARFIHYSEGQAYFIGPFCEVILIDGDKIDGINFFTEECCQDEVDDLE